MVLYATVGLESFTFHEVEKRLDRAGAQVPAQELRESIERLILAYVIKKQAGSYVYPVPLLREYLMAETEGAPDEMLALETRDWNRSALP